MLVVMRMGSLSNLGQEANSQNFPDNFIPRDLFHLAKPSSVISIEFSATGNFQRLPLFSYLTNIYAI